MILHPVVARRDGTRGRAGVERARRLGRLCLERSSALSGAADATRPPPASGDAPGGGGLRGADGFSAPAYPRDADGAPLPHRGRHWSTTNTEGLVAAVVAPFPVAIDAEWCGRPRLDAAREHLGPDELRRVSSGGVPPELALWTAKEAVLKLERVGLAGLPRCRLVHDDGSGTMRVSLAGRRYPVRRLLWGEFVLALAWDSPLEVDLRLHELEEVRA